MCVCSTRHADAVVHMRVHYLWKWDLPPAVAQWHVKSGLIQHSANARHTLFINSIQFPRTLISLLPPTISHTLLLARSLAWLGWLAPICCGCRQTRVLAAGTHANSAVDWWWWLWLWLWRCAVVPTLLLELGSNLNPEDIEEGDDVYFECKVHANPAAYKVIWKHNVSIRCTLCARRLSSLCSGLPTWSIYVYYDVTVHV